MDVNGKTDGRLTWQTPLRVNCACAILAPRRRKLPNPCWTGCAATRAVAERQIEPSRLAVKQGPRRLTFRLHQQTGDSNGSGSGGWLIVMRESSDDAVVQAIALSFRPTAKEGECCIEWTKEKSTATLATYWVPARQQSRNSWSACTASPACKSILQPRQGP